MQRYFSSCLTHSPAFLPPWASLAPGPLLQMFAGHKASDLPKTSIPAFPPASTSYTCLSRGGPESRTVCPLKELVVLLPLAPSRFPFLPVEVRRYCLTNGDRGTQEQMRWTRACPSCSRAPVSLLPVRVFLSLLHSSISLSPLSLCFSPPPPFPFSSLFSFATSLRNPLLLKKP